MSDLLAIYIIIGLFFTILLLFSGDTTQMLAERSFPWRLLWTALVTVLWFPILIIVFISRVKESRK